MNENKRKESVQRDTEINKNAEYGRNRNVDQGIGTSIKERKRTEERGT